MGKIVAICFACASLLPIEISLDHACCEIYTIQTPSPPALFIHSKITQTQVNNKKFKLLVVRNFANAHRLQCCLYNRKVALSVFVLFNRLNKKQRENQISTSEQ